MKLYKVPLSGPYNTRVSAVNASDSTSGYVGTGIAGLMIVGKTSQPTDKDTRYINCFRVKDGKLVGIVKRPGFGTAFTPWAGNLGYALLVWTGGASGIDLISGFGSTNSNIYNGNTLLGAITGRVTGITESVVGSTTPTVTITSNDNTGWYYDTGVGVPTKIADVDFPGNAGKIIAGTFAHLKGFACVFTTDGFLYAGDINTMTGWTSNSFDSANTSPDKGVASLIHKEFVVTLGTESMEFWYNAGLSPFPLARASAKTVKVGAVSADAIAQISDTFWWCGSTPQGGLSIFQYDGTLSRVSEPAVDAILILAGASNISMTTIRHYGYSFVLVRAGPTTFAYCVEEKFWFEWNSTTPLWYKVVGISQGGTMVNYAISNVSTSGKVYAQNHASLTFEDAGVAYTARIQTAREDQGTNRWKFYSFLDIIGDVETSASPLTVSVSDDDYQTYDVLGTVDLSDQHRRLTILGSARSRAWVFTHAANTPMRLERAEGELEVGN
jgi:hypothetical protein